MDNLRLILLLLGVAVIAAIWAFEVWRRRRNAALRDDPFADIVDEDYDIDALPSWREDDFPDPDAVTVPGAVAQAERSRASRRGPEASPARPRDLFDEEPDDDAPPLGDLPSMRATRDDSVAEPEAELPPIVPGTGERGPDETPPEPRATSHTPAASRSADASSAAGTLAPDDDRRQRTPPVARPPVADEPESQDQPPVADESRSQGEPRVADHPPSQDQPSVADESPSPGGSPLVDTGGDRDAPDESAEPPAPPPQPGPPAAVEQPERPEQVLSLTVMARPGRRFVGHQIRAALESVGMRFGDMDIFHRHGESVDDTPGPTLFAAVNVLKPGTFDLSNLGELATPGVALFMQVPGPADPQQTFELMLDTARRLAERLGGEVGDAARQPLSAAKLAAMHAIAAGEEEDGTA